MIAGWSQGRCATDQVADALVGVVRRAFGPTGHVPAEADHIVPPTGRFRRAAMGACVTARGDTAGTPTWVDLAPAVGNPAGASNLLQLATSASLIAAGKICGPGLAVSTGITGTLSAVVLSPADRE